jgi:hypothetical protein
MLNPFETSWIEIFLKKGKRDIIIEYRKLNAVNDNIKQVTHTGQRIESNLRK